MTIHKEGFATIIIVLASLLIINIITCYLSREYKIIFYSVLTASILFLLFILFFFRVPERQLLKDETVVVSPADGKVIIIEEIYENEYFKENRLKVSIFMSPFNVHLNRYPFSGVISYCKYHPGKYLVAFHPKASELNERSTVVVKSLNGTEVLLRQIAGCVARRIVTYSKDGEQVKQTDELGFIKFGSRVDLYFPIGTKLNVKIGDKVQAGVSNIADLK